MRNFLSLSILFLSTSFAFSQVESDSTTLKKAKINRWSVDVSFGNSHGNRPYNDGYFSTENDKFLGEFNLNSVNLGTRFFLNKYVTFKSDLAFDRFIPTNKKSKDFNVAQFRLSIQTMFNLNSVFGIKESSKFKILPHIGFNISTLKTIKSSQNQTIGSPDNMLGFVYGLSPMYNFSKKAAIFIDLEIINNFRQHHTWDGNVSNESNNLTGVMSNMSIGISYKLGNPIVVVSDDELKKLEAEKVKELEKRVGDIETLMNDTDKDGVADYLDSENNSVAGVAVDSRGVMVDINRNGVPDELERYFEAKYGTTDNDKISIEKNKTPQQLTGFDSKEMSKLDFLEKSINDGYISVFFEVNSTKPNTLSLDGVNFILTYLNSNLKAKVDIIGYADNAGNKSKNEKLALARANSVKKILVNSGIDETRLNVISGGEAQINNSSSQDTRSLVRKVIFKLK
ncbi:MAG: OmpA family protein [Flavobacterium sp.]